MSVSVNYLVDVTIRYIEWTPLADYSGPLTTYTAYISEKELLVEKVGIGTELSITWCTEKILQVRDKSNNQHLAIRWWTTEPHQKDE